MARADFVFSTASLLQAHSALQMRRSVAPLCPLNAFGKTFMDVSAKATRIQLLDLHSPPMRAFHMSWIAFFFCFFAWLHRTADVDHSDEFQLTKDQVGWCIIGSVAITFFARLFVGWLCDRLVHVWLTRAC